MKLCLKILVLATFLILSACGFQPRSAKQLAPQLHGLCIYTPKPSSTFSHKLNKMLLSLDLKVYSSCSHAPYELHVYSTHLARDNPNITTADQALTFNYTYNVDFDLKNNRGQTIIARRTLTATRSVVLNAQQIFTPYNTNAIEKQLEQVILNQIFDQLTITQTKNNFARYPAN